MDWFVSLVSFWANLANRIALIAVNIQEEWWAPDWLKSVMAEISQIADDIFTAFFNFRYWLEELADRVASFLSWDQIQDRLQTWFDQVSQLWDWLLDWWNNVTYVIEYWWTGAMGQVQDWINTAVEGLGTLQAEWSNFWTITWPEWTAQLTVLQAAWTSFWTETVPTLLTFSALGDWWQSRVLDIQGMIEGAFTLRGDLWSGWQELRDQVVAFFADPWEWLYNRLDDFIERFW